MPVVENSALEFHRDLVWAEVNENFLVVTSCVCVILALKSTRAFMIEEIAREKQDTTRLKGLLSNLRARVRKRSDVRC